MSELWYYSDLDHDPNKQPEEIQQPTEQNGDNPAMPSFTTLIQNDTTPHTDS